MSESMLRMENVTMQFGGVVAVNNLSLNVDKGEIVALIGPNGAGKTTAFNCITGVYQPTNGKVFFEDNLMVSALQLPLQSVILTRFLHSDVSIQFYGRFIHV